MFTTHPVETSAWKKNPVSQYLKGFGGCAVPASEVRVYRSGKLVRTEPATFFLEVSKKGCNRGQAR